MHHQARSVRQTRREYNQWVATETLEDYSLRYTPKSYRKWPELLIANTAIGSISFLALEAIGATIAMHYGFETAFFAILLASIIIFITAIPISYYAARYNIDIDLLTRSAGFGYVGSTVTSLIYASFCFIFFALEAAILAQALKLISGLPLAWGYLLSSLIIIPMVFYGITFINKLQLWTQPIWIIMMVAPFIYVVGNEPGAMQAFVSFEGSISHSSEFNSYYFGFAVGISLALIAQIGEQVDYIRFMPPLTHKNKLRWWSAMLIAGPGWIILGFLKQIGGIFLAAVVILAGMSVHEAKTPIQMYYVAYQYVFDNPEIALFASTIFVVISQIKINVTNAYAGSLAWSNFFSRVTHTHPGRVVWMVFNIFIALLLMELGVFDVLEKVLGLYSNVAIAWIGTIVADLMINKPFGLSPKITEFKRAYLYNFNPVGMGSLGIASVISILAFVGVFGDWAQSYSSLIALGLALIFCPLIAWITEGKYYIARTNKLALEGKKNATCKICDSSYEIEDMAYCPFHQIEICSLCCSLESLCHDTCKKESERGFRKAIGYRIRLFFGKKISTKGALRLFDFFIISGMLFFISAVIGWMIFSMQAEDMPPESIIYLENAFIQFFVLSGILLSVIAWWILLLQESRHLAEHDLEEQNIALGEEVEVRRSAESKAHHLANFDSLTGLPNRYLFHVRLEQAVLCGQRDKERFALLFLDLDKFKVVNDSLGHEAGDELLKLISGRLKSCLRKSDLTARLGGDEFIVLIQPIQATDEVARVAQNILRLMDQEFNILGHKIKSSLSIGISIFPEDGRDSKTLLRNADLAMYKVKDENKNSFKFFNKTMNDDIDSHLLVEQELEKAIVKNQLVLHYQPQLRFGKLVGLEALVRWRHPNKGLILPDAFIPDAEQSDLIVKLGDWVLDESLRQVAEWVVAGFKVVPVSINVSGKQLTNKGFIKTLTQKLDKHRLSGKLIVLELTERSVMDRSSDGKHCLSELKKLGLSLSIDDFGTGYSSLSYLGELPVDNLKIDISFVKNITSNSAVEAVVKTIINLAKNLNLSVVAEGVETKEQLALLEKNGVSTVQGFLFHEALSPEKVELIFYKNQERAK